MSPSSWVGFARIYRCGALYVKSRPVKHTLLKVKFKLREITGEFAALPPLSDRAFTLPYKKGKSGLAGRYMHWEAYCEYPYVPVELFTPFSAVPVHSPGASSLRVRASHTSIATLRAHERQRAADVPSLP
jgi:hypothetical protein